MWKRPWNLKEGFIIGMALILLGLLLQQTVGAVNWNSVAYPVNVILLASYLIILFCCFCIRKKIYFIEWLNSYASVVPALIWTVLLTFVMGITKQVPEGEEANDMIGLSKMLSFWPFILIYLWTTTILGLTILKRLSTFCWKKDIPFLLNHTGLFVALIAATLGSADIQQLEMTVPIHQRIERAIDKTGEIHELPLSIQLNKFTIDEYPPKLMIADEANPLSNAAYIEVEKSRTKGKLKDWNIQVERYISDVSKVYVIATHRTKNIIKRGWVCCGNYQSPYTALQLDSTNSIVMLDREPRRFSSDVTIYTQSGKELKAEIEVNKPYEVDGWKIYQLSYDEMKGKWSDISVFELVTDPWLPFVYIGIGMLILGAIGMFVTTQKQKEEEQ